MTWSNYGANGVQKNRSTLDKYRVNGGAEGYVEFTAFIIRDTMSQFRALTAAEITSFQKGGYSHVQLNGYYAKGDTPTPIDYRVDLADTTTADDGGSVIVISGVRFKHMFSAGINPLYFGAQTGLVQSMINKTGFTYIITSTLSLGGATINIPTNGTLRYAGGVINNGTLFANTGVKIEGIALGTARMDLQPVGAEVVADTYTNISNASDFVISKNNKKFKLTNDSDVATRARVDFVHDGNSRVIEIDLQWKSIKSSTIQKQIRSYILSSIIYNPVAEDKVIYFIIKNGTLDNIQIAYQATVTNTLNFGVDYTFTNVTFKDADVSLGHQSSIYNKFKFIDCKFINCAVITYNPDRDWSSGLTLSSWNSTRKSYFSDYYFHRCDFIAGTKNLNNVELLHLADMSPLSRTVVRECKFYVYNDITSDIIDCYDGSNILIEGCFFICKVGGTVGGILAPEPTFINIKAHAPSYGALVADSGFSDQSPFNERRNVVIKHNTFVPLQPNTRSNENTPSIIKCNTYQRTDTTTLAYTTARTFTEFSDNYIYLNALDLATFAIVHSIKGNKYNIIRNNKVFVEEKVFAGVVFPTQTYTMSEKVTIDNLFFYSNTNGDSTTDPNDVAVDENVVIDGNMIYNKSTTSGMVMLSVASAVGTRIRNIYIKDNILSQPSVAIVPYSTNVDLNQLRTSGNSFDGLVKNITVTSSTQQAVSNFKYIADSATLVTVTLPLEINANIGDRVVIRGKGVGLWKLAQNASQVIHTPSGDTTVGTGGSVQAPSRYDYITIEKIANNEWTLIEGSITLITT